MGLSKTIRKCFAKYGSQPGCPSCADHFRCIRVTEQNKK